MILIVVIPQLTSVDVGGTSCSEGSPAYFTSLNLMSLKVTSIDG
jgi:hypothetical protein